MVAFLSKQYYEHMMKETIFGRAKDVTFPRRTTESGEEESDHAQFMVRLPVTVVETAQSFCRALGGARLAAVVEYKLGDHAHRRSGMPDLVLWHARRHYVRVVEVKGPKDTLSAKQRLWLEWFAAHDVDAQLCAVVAQHPKRIK